MVHERSRPPSLSEIARREWNAKRMTKASIVVSCKGPQENLIVNFSATSSLHHTISLYTIASKHPDLGGRVTIVYVLFLRLSIGSYGLINAKKDSKRSAISLFLFFFLTAKDNTSKTNKNPTKCLHTVILRRKWANMGKRGVFVSGKMIQKAFSFLRNNSHLFQDQ